MKLKQTLSAIHLWIGLISAPIVFFICITGTILVFCDEIMEMSAGEARYVQEVQPQKLSTEHLIEIIEKEMPGYKSSYAVFYQEPERSIRFNCFKKGEGLRMVFINQYTGEILKADKAIYFFYIVAHLHSSFMWHGVGTWIIDITTLMFLIASITGLVLWWPKKWGKKYRKASLTIKTNANNNRLNLDLHKVLGFYALALTLVLASTGLLIAFKPLSGALKNISGGDSSISIKQHFQGTPKDSTLATTPINTIVKDAFALYPHKNCVQLKTFNLNKTNHYIITIANKIGILSGMDANLVAYEKYTGQRYNIPKTLLINDNVENIYWTLHMGNYMGLLGKILTFIAGLTTSSLPVTGFIIWRGKRKKIKQLNKLNT